MLLAEFYKRGGRTHHPDDCWEDFCCIHNPSDHKMKDWTMNLRETGLIERLCDHSVGHPDPDSVVYMNNATETGGGWGTHGCDGCCRD